MDELKGQVALVTGGGTSIGRAASFRFISAKTIARNSSSAGLAERVRARNQLQTALIPDVLAGAYAFLVSPWNVRGITGTILSVDGGGLIRMPGSRPS